MAEKCNPSSLPSDSDEPNPEEKKRLMEEAQEDAAKERESEGGYQ